MYIYLVWGAEINGWPFKKLKMLSIFPMVYPALSSNVASWEIPKLNVWFFHCHLWLPKGNPPSLGDLIGSFMLCVFCRASQANPRCKPLNSEVRWALRNNKKKSKQNSDSTKAVPNHPRSSKILSFSKFRSREPGVASGSLRPCWFLSGLPNRTLTHRYFCTQELLHTDAYTHTVTHRRLHTHRHFCTQKLLHTDAFTH